MNSFYKMKKNTMSLQKAITRSYSPMSNSILASIAWIILISMDHSHHSLKLYSRPNSRTECIILLIQAVWILQVQNKSWKRRRKRRKRSQMHTKHSIRKSIWAPFLDNQRLMSQKYTKVTLVRVNILMKTRQIRTISWQMKKQSLTLWISTKTLIKLSR